jgi:hypothetical protein
MRSTALVCVVFWLASILAAQSVGRYIGNYDAALLATVNQALESGR